MIAKSLECATYAGNLRRLMAHSGLTISQTVAATGLHPRTVKSLLRGRSKPQPRTLHKLADGLGVSVDEFFRASVDGETDGTPHRADYDVLEKVHQLLETQHRNLVVGLVHLLYQQTRHPK